MVQHKTQRRLTAILAADVVGFSKLMAEDETATLAALSHATATIIEPLVAEHSGRVVKFMGDGILAEFASVVDAVNCAIDWQHRIEGASLSPSLTFRIGVNIGDVVVENHDIFGSGVNDAARLESLADPGGICISAMVHGEISGKISANFEDLGEKTVKDHDTPLRVFRLGRDVATPKLPLPEKPSIAVLPFDNMSNDQEQEFLADGITEDLITALSKIRWFFVIARNSTFTYKGQAVDVTQVAAELGVKYVLEGSVRKAGQRVRVTAQLIDATSGHHVWAERYDRDLADIFDLQDEMTQTIIGAVEPEISATERKNAAAKPPDSLDAWESYQRGIWHMWSYGQDDHEKALYFLERACELDPNFASAYGYLTYVHYQSVVMGWTTDIEGRLNAGQETAHKALAADQRDAIAHFAIGRIQMMKGALEDSIASLETSISINPSFAQAYHGLGMSLCLSGRYDAAKKANQMCERLSPRDPIIWASLVVQTLTRILEGNFDEALIWARKTLQNPRAKGYWPHTIYAAALAQTGQINAARDQVKAALKAVPHLTLGELAQTYKTKEPDGLAPYLDGLRKAGMPE